MALKHRKRILLAKTEAVYGVDITPVTTDAVQTRNLEINVLGDAIGLDIDLPTLGSSQALHVGSHIEVTFEVPLQASGSAGTEPAWDELIEACGITGTNTPATSEVYAGDSDQTASLTMYVHLDGQKFLVTGARGTFSIIMNIGEIPVIQFRFLGLYNAPAAVADPVPDVTDYVAPIPVTSTNTPTYAIHGQAVEGQSFQFDLGNELIYEDLMAGAEAVEIVDRLPSAQTQVRMLALGTWNPWTISQANTEGAFSLIHGTAAGKILTLAGAQAQLMQPSMAESNGIRYLTTGVRFNSTAAGDDDFTLTLT